MNIFKATPDSFRIFFSTKCLNYPNKSGKDIESAKYFRKSSFCNEITNFHL